MLEDDNRNWEAELHQRASELLANRLNPLKAELEQLQAISARLQEQVEISPTTTDIAAVSAHVNEWLQAQARQTEAEYQTQLQQALTTARVQIADEVRGQLEAEFQTKLEQSILLKQREVESELEQLRSQLADLNLNQPSLVAASPSLSAHNTLLKTAIEEIDAQRTQSETLTALINRAASFAPRVAFFVVKSGEAVGWKTLGFENGLSDETARTLSVSIQSPSLIGQALGSQHAAIALNPSQAEVSLVLGRFSHPVPQGAVAVPLVVRGKAAAVLYADSGNQSEEAVQLEAIEALIQVASMAIELLPGRRSAGDTGRPHAFTQPSTAVPAVSPAVAMPTTPPTPTVSAAVVENPGPTPVDHAGVFAPVTQKPDEIAPVEYSTDAATNRPAVSLADLPEAAAVKNDFSADEEETALPQTNYTTQSEEVYEGSASPAQPIPPSPVARGDEKPSIYDLLRTGPAEPQPPSSGQGLSLPSYSTPETPSLASLNDLAAKPGMSLPGWMQRLQEDTVSDETPKPFPFVTSPDADTSTWPTSEEAFSPVPKLAPPPPPPPPVRVPALPENIDLPPAEIETERLPSPPAAQPFQVESPSVRFSFNQPSEPPRYAAPSLSVSNAATETEVRAHNDARRFARLLVSEIKLYNAAKVNEGRRLSDLYDRLKDEVDRSRKVYDKRVSPAVATKFDYFYDELVQTLAEGDPTKLGENCPGPVVLAS